MKEIEKAVLTEAETVSRSNWTRDLVYSKTLLNLLLGSIPSMRVETAIYEFLGEFPSTLDYKQSFPLNRTSRFLTNPVHKLKMTLKIAFWIGAHLEIESEISRMPKILEKIASRENKNHFLMQQIRAMRNKTESDYLSYELGSMSSNEVKVFQNVLLCGAGLIVTSSKSVYIADPAANPHQTFIAGLWNHISFNSVLNKITFHGLLQSGTVSKEYERGIDLTGRCASNYWHALIEYVPRILNFDSSENIPVFISKETPGTVRQALLSINPNMELVEISEGHWIRVGELHVPKFHTKTLDSGRLTAPHMFECDSNLLSEFRTQIISKLNSNHSFVAKKVYLRRSSQFRSPIGIDELETVLEENGFVFISPEDLSFSEQVQLFQGAEVVVTFGGAAWANLIFANPKSTYISLTSEASAAFDMHSEIAKVFHLNYYQLISKNIVSLEELSPFYRFYCHHSVRVTSEMLDELKALIS